MNIDFNHFTQRQSCLFGAMLGDIVGVPHEFRAPDTIYLHYIKNPSSIPMNCKTYGDVPHGVYSDDFSQTICVDTCLNMPIGDFYKEMMLWRSGKYWVNNRLFDIGIQTGSSLHNFRSTGNCVRSGGAGNGAIMRLAPLAFDSCENEYTFNDKIEQYTKITHYNDVCFATSKFYVHLLRTVAANPSVDFNTNWNNTLARYPVDFSTPNFLGSGYVIDTLLTIKHCLTTTNSLSAAIVAAIQLGEDTDTNASCVGAVAALQFGIGNISDEWIHYIQPSLYNPYVKSMFNLN